jgi:hypothetical protein
MAQMQDDQLRAITDGEMRQAVGYWSGKLGNMRQQAMQYYLGEATGDLSPPEVEGRSSVVSPDVRNTIEAMLPTLTKQLRRLTTSAISTTSRTPAKRSVMRG